MTSSYLALITKTAYSQTLPSTLPIKNTDLSQNNATKETDHKLPFKNSSFDNIICLSVLSLIGPRKNIKDLINEFLRILKPGGLLLIDINGKKGHFAKDKTKKIICFKSKKEFSKLINFNYAKILFNGEIYKNYSNISDHEFIMLLKKL